MVLGAQSPENALASEELAAKLGAGLADVEAELKRLVEGGYAATTRQSGTQKVYLTGTGVITASSTYS
jgi:Fic family protein